MKKCIAILMLLLLAAIPLQATAKDTPLSGNFWFLKCTSKENVDKGLCMGFTVGMAEAIVFIEGSYRKIRGEFFTSGSFCVPDGVNMGQYKDIFVDYLRKHPEKRHERASVLFADAIRKAFCK